MMRFKYIWLALFISTFSFAETDKQPESISSDLSCAKELNQKIEQLTNENQALLHENKQLKAQNNQLLQQIDTLIATSRKHTPSPSGKQETQSAYEQGHVLFKNKQYLQTIKLLKFASNGGDQSEEAQNAMYLLSQSHYRLRHCEAAISIGNRFIEIFPQNKNAPNVLYNVAKCQLYMQQKDVARNTLKRLIQHYPYSNAAKNAQNLVK